MSGEIETPNIYSRTFSEELAKGVIEVELKYTEGYDSLDPEQRRWFDRYAAPMLVQEGLETGRATARELAEGGETRGERLASDVEVYLEGVGDTREEFGK